MTPKMHSFSLKMKFLYIIQDKYNIEKLKREYAETAHYWRTSNGGFLGLLPTNPLRFATIVTGYEWIVRDIFLVV